MKHSITISIFGLLMIFAACHKPVKGCTDMTALNYNSSAEDNDGSCTFSQMTFFARYGFYNGIPITSIDVTVNGNAAGTINTVYPVPSMTSAPGLRSLAFAS